MGEIFEFIFGNMFLVILIISGIIGMLSSNKEQQKKQQQQRPNRPQQSQPRQQRQQRQPRPASASTRQETMRERPKVVATAKAEPVPKEVTATPAPLKSLQEEQQAQMERLRERYRAADVSITDGDVIGEDDFISRQQMEVLKSLSEEQKVLKKDIRRSLKNKGLINGIVMAEVLGRPRSMKPYWSVTSERYKR